MNRRVYQTVRQKREWQEPITPAEAEREKALGSKGWYTRGYLPHFDQPGTIQMVTYRLADAMPASRRHEWAALLGIEDERERQTKIEEYLDLGYGECHLRDGRIASVVEENWLHFDGQRFRLAAWVVMPNHVHVLFEMWDEPLPRVVKSWKAYSGNRANRLLGRSGAFWQVDFWDRYVRDEAHFNQARHYIEWNPVKAHLVKGPEDWDFSSANPKWRWSGASRYGGARVIHEGVATITSVSGGQGTGGSDDPRSDPRSDADLICMVF